MKYFFSKKALPNYIIWIIILIPTYILKYQVTINEGILEPLYLILEAMVWFILAVILTAGIQFCIEKFITKPEHVVIKIIKFIGFVVIATLLFNLILWPILEVLFVAVQDKEKIKYAKLPTNYYNWFVWIVWYAAISFISLYNEVKEANIKNAELLSNLKESQLNILKGQINPHFMFNTLNNIRGLMLEDVEKARDMLTSLSETLRYSLTKSDKNSIALEDELEMVENYISISKIQFDDRLQFEMHIDGASLHTQIPPMIIQMLIENAVKHGISNLKKGGVISLTSKISDKHLLIEVVNSGTLTKSKISTQLGILNIKKRLNLLYGEAATFDLKEIENQVFASIKIPIT